MKREDEVLDAVSKEDTVKLRELAGHYSDEAAIHQEEALIKLAMITYCFHKIFIKLHMRQKTEALVEHTLKKLAQKDYDSIIGELVEFDREHGLFEGGLVDKARIKIASRLHSRGISVAQSAGVTGARVSDIIEYFGETRGHQHVEGKSVEERLNIARDILQ